jgi:hypothetical protein
MFQVGKDVGQSLSPLQLGVGISGGSEIAARIAQHFFDYGEGFVTIKTDFSNAFNSIPRRRIYDGLVIHCPRLLPWFRWAYGRPSDLLDSRGNTIGVSGSGCRQGDPLASLLFCVAIQPALHEIQSMIVELTTEYNLALPEGGLVIQTGQAIGYMDDLSLSLPYQLANAVCSKLDVICGKYGLQLNLDKCRIIGESTPKIDNPVFSTLLDGDMILGSPTGTPEFRRLKCIQAAQVMSKSIVALEKIQLNSCIRFNLLRACYNPRMSYLSRVQDPSLSRDALLIFDKSIDIALALSIKEPIDDNSAVLIFLATIRALPTSMGGLGIPRYSWCAGSAGAIQSRSLTREFIHFYLPALSRVINDLPPIYLRAIEDCPFQGVVRPTGVSDDDFGDDRDINYLSKSEINKRLLLAYGWTRLQLVNCLFRAKEGARASWFFSSDNYRSGKWLSPPVGLIPDYRESLVGVEFQTALRQRLLLEPLSFTPGICKCGHHTLSYDEPFHFLDCPSTGHIRTARHDFVVRVIERWMRRFVTGSVVTRNPPLPFGSHPTEAAAKQGDLEITLPDGTQYVIDVTISNPAAPTFRALEPWRIRNVTNNQRERDKLRFYQRTHPVWVAEGRIIPFAVEATGGIGTKAIVMLEALLPKCAESTAAISHLFNQISTVVAKYNSQCLQYLSHVVAQMNVQ